MRESKPQKLNVTTHATRNRQMVEFAVLCLNDMMVACLFVKSRRTQAGLSSPSWEKEGCCAMIFVCYEQVEVTVTFDT